MSGFLITTLLLEERERTGAVALGSFWVRRARRLLPALGVMLVVVAAVTLAVGSAAQRGELRRDLPWSIFYLGNWGQIVGGIPYYAADPPLLRHLWSLAIEEQFYLVWPLVFVGLARTGLSNQAIARLLGGTAVVVMVWVFWLHAGGPGPVDVFGGVDRVNFMYLSTFTRAGGLLLGCAGGVRLAPVADAGTDGPARGARPGPSSTSPAGLALGVLGCVASVAVLTDGLRVPVAAAAGVGPVAGRRPRRRPPGRGRDAPGARLPAARRHRRPQLRAVPVALADLRARRRDHGVRPPVRRRARRHRRRRRAVLPLRRGAGAAGRAEPVVAHRRDRSAAGPCSSPPAPWPLLAVVLRRPSTRSTAPPAVPTPRSTRRPRRSSRPTTVAAARPRPSCRRPRRQPAPRRVAIVGDSQAHTLAVNLPDGIESTFTVTDGGLDGCSVYDAGRVRSPDELRQLVRQRAPGGPRSGPRRRPMPTPRSRSSSSGPGTCSTSSRATARGWRSGRRRGTPTCATQPAVRHRRRRRRRGRRWRCSRCRACGPVKAEGAGVPPLPERGDDAHVAHVNELFRSVAAANTGHGHVRRGTGRVVRRRGGGHRRRHALGRRARLHAGRQADLRHDRPGAAGRSRCPGVDARFGAERDRGTWATWLHAHHRPPSSPSRA